VELRWAAAAAAAWICGSIPWGLWIGRLRGVDVRRHGSGNLGATNVYRVLGPRLGITVLLLDAAKGVAAVLLARAIVGAGGDGAAAGSGSRLLAAGLLGLLAAVLGHSFTPFAGFRGGKGVATAAGAWGVLAPGAFAVAFGLWVAVFAACRIVSAASIVAAAALPVAAGVLSHAPLRDPVFWGAVVTGALILLRHRGNLVRLRRREERALDLRGPRSEGPPPGR